MKPLLPLQMDYPCPVKTNDLLKLNNGKFCIHCTKYIPDLSKASNEEIMQRVEQCIGQFCAILPAYRIQNPYGNWKDRIVTFYQRVDSKSRKSYFLIFIAGCLLTITGCKRITRGVPGYSHNGLPVLRVNPQSMIEYTDAPDFIKHNMYKVNLRMKKEKKVKRSRRPGK